MFRDSGQREKTVTAVNSDENLYEVGSKDVWQLPLKTLEGMVGGVVVRQVVEPKMYTVRYLVIYSPDEGRQFVIPATVVSDISADGVVCDVTEAELARLPSFEQDLSRSQETKVHDVLNRTPYWIEERALKEPDSFHDSDE